VAAKRLEFGALVVKIVAQQALRSEVDGHEPLLGAFSEHPKNARLRIEISKHQVDEFGDA